ncbi:hypothetical protein TI04_06410 [Achromatium sp. WMS2]|nr:hypothetical protein TI04_06410 [Achromatium sp. WMS2]
MWQDSQSINTVVANMAIELRAVLNAKHIENPIIVGIHTGGIWVAQSLYKLLQLQTTLGILDIAFYRDDFTKIGLHPVVRPSQLPEDIDERHIILVDDILHTGRTIRAALNALFDYGRPSSVLLAVLAARNGRELPIAPDIVGWHANIPSQQYLKLTGPHPLQLIIT